MGPDPLDPAMGDNNSNNKLRQEEERKEERMGKSGKYKASWRKIITGTQKKDKMDPVAINIPTISLMDTQAC